MSKPTWLLPIFALVACCASPQSPPQEPVKTASDASSCALPRQIVVGQASDRNILGSPLAACSEAPLTGFFRDGRCSTGPDDTGVHVVCSEVTSTFLQFTKARGNDLETPRGGFAGLKPGDRWCLCAGRWREAEEAGVAPPVIAEATHNSATRVVSEAALTAHRIPLERGRTSK